MRVVFKNYIITQSFGIGLYDISRSRKALEGKNKGQIVEKNEAYGVTLKRAFAVILDGVIEAELKDVETTLEKYLQKHDECIESLKKEIQGFEVALNNDKIPQVNSIN